MHTLKKRRVRDMENGGIRSGVAVRRGGKKRAKEPRGTKGKGLPTHVERMCSPHRGKNSARDHAGNY